MRNKEKDEAQIAENKRRIMDEAFRLFAQKGIVSVTMPEIAKAGKMDRSSVYRYYPSKLDLVIATSTKKWEEYINSYRASKSDEELKKMTGAEILRWYMDSFIDLYRNHRDILRFNYDFNSFLREEKATSEQKQPYSTMVDKLSSGFHLQYLKGVEDGTFRTDISEEAMFSSSFHIMLAAVTRYAVGLAYTTEKGSDPESELVMLEELLLKRYIKD